MEVAVKRYMLVPSIHNCSCHLFLWQPPKIKGKIKSGKKTKHNPSPIYWLHTIHPNIPRARKGTQGVERGEWIDRECCQGLVLDSMVIREKRRTKTKRKFTGVVLSGRTLNWEAHRGRDNNSKKKDYSEEKEKLSKGRQPSEESCLSNLQSHTHTQTHYALGWKSFLVHGRWLW